MEKELKNIRRLLILIVIPLVFYLLSILSTIFIPLTFGIFIALLFSPVIRWFKERRVPKAVGVLVVLLIVSAGGYGTYQAFHLAGNEIAHADENFLEKVNESVDNVIKPALNFAGIEIDNIGDQVRTLLQDEKILERVFGNVGSGLNFATQLLTMLLMTVFFMLLLLAESVDIEKAMEAVIFKNEKLAASTYREIEKVIFKFIMVRSILGLITAVGVSLTCYFFGVSFPVFWGVVTFFLNFIQMIGPVVTVVALGVFAVIELNLTGALFFFILINTGIFAVLGGVVEPILMGRSFSINTVTVLIMLALWGIIWGIPGMILSIPIAALIKTVMEKFPGTAVYAKIMS